MGGIPTNYHGEVLTLKDGNPDTIVPGLLAIGEAACVSVHGANRLGSNSLIDLVVFGRAAGLRCGETVEAGAAMPTLPKDADELALSRLDRVRHAAGSTPTSALRLRMQKAMQTNCAVFRTGPVLEEGVADDPRRLEGQRRHPGLRSLAGLELRPGRDAGVREPDRAGRHHRRGAPTAPKAAARTRARTIPSATTRTG